MNIKDFKRTKFLFGYFLLNDYSYTQKKGDFFNKVRNQFANENLLLIGEKNLGDIFLNENNQSFRITTKSDALHYENNNTKEEFVKDVKNLVNLHWDIFKNEEIIKIGFVQYFEIEKESLGDTFLVDNFFKNLPFEKYKTDVLDFHMNFKKEISNKEYNFNMTINQEILNKKIFGNLDMNIAFKDRYKGERLLKKEDVVEIFEILDDYYKKEFINDFFNHGK